MTLVFDTTTISALLKANEQIMKIAGSDDYDRLVIPLAADAELRFGYAHGTKAMENLARYTSMIQTVPMQLSFPGQDESIVYADLATWAKRHGVALSHNDFWIAATAICAGGKLLTFDKDFSRLPQVSLVKL